MECGMGDHPYAVERASFFQSFAEYFGVFKTVNGVDWTKNLKCGSMGQFKELTTPVFWGLDWRAEGACKPEQWVSPCSMLDYPSDPALSYCRCDMLGASPFVEKCTGAPFSR